MAINFPPGPHEIGDTYTEDGLTWEWNGVKWIPVGGGGGDQFWQQNGDNIFYDAGSVGVGVDAPQTALHVQTDAAGEIRLEGADGSSAHLRLNSGTDNANSVFVATGSFGVTGQPDTNLALGTNDVNGAIMFTQAGAELGRVDAGGRLLLGQNDLTGIDGEADRIVAANNAGNSGITVRSGSDRQGALYFADQDAANVGRIEYNHPDNWMRFHTNGVERFRYSADGALGVAGPNFGTAGQVLTSQGNAAAPQWADAAGGGTGNLETFTVGDSLRTEILLTGIPDEATRIIVDFDNVASAAATHELTLQVGDANLVTAGNGYRHASSRLEIGAPTGTSATFSGSDSRYRLYNTGNCPSVNQPLLGHIEFNRRRTGWSIRHDLRSRINGHTWTGVGNVQENVNINQISILSNELFFGGFVLTQFWF